MEFDHILIRYGEIGLKGNNMKFFLRRLQRNIAHKLTKFPNVHVKHTRGRLLILLNGHDPQPILEKTRQVLGMHSMSFAIKAENELDTIKDAALYALQTSKHTETHKIPVTTDD